MKRFVLIGAMVYDLRAIPYKKSKDLNQPIRLRTQAGGTARNAAEKLAALGHEPILISACGLDMSGNVLIEDAIAKGIDIRYVKQLPSDKTSSFLVICDEYDQPISTMVDEGVLNAIDNVYLYTTMRDFTDEDIFVVDNNLTVEQLHLIVNQHHNTWLLPSENKSIQPLMHLLPYFKGLQLNEQMIRKDFQCLCEPLDEALPKIVKAHQLTAVIVPTSDHGIYYADKQRIIHVTSPWYKPIIQPCACEIVLSAFLSKCSQHMPVEKALEYALGAFLLENEKKHEKTFVLKEEKIIERLQAYQIKTKEALYVSKMY